MTLVRVENTAEDFPATSSFADLGSFLLADRIPDGQLEINHRSLPIELLNLPAGSDTTFVFFHGAAEKDVRLPWFVGKGISSGLPVNRIFISDPSLRTAEELRLSWYAGSAAQPDLQEALADIIRRIVRETGGYNLVFFGSSGGGFATLAVSRFFPSSLALAVNPQTSLGRYYKSASNRFMTHGWGMTDRELTELPGTVAHDLVRSYQAGFRHTVAYVQNARDWFHIQNHQLPFLEAVGASENVYMLMDRWGPATGDGHTPPPKELLRQSFELLANCRGDWSSALLASGFQQGTRPQDVSARLRETAPSES